MLWHDALALVERESLTFCNSLVLSDSLCDSDGSPRATCALLRHDFFAFILGRVIRTQPLPDTSMTIGEFQEDAHTWASDIGRSTLQFHFRHRTLLTHGQTAALPPPAPFIPHSTHVFTHLSRPMRTVFCHQSWTPGQRTAFCLSGGLLQTRLPLPNEFISKSHLALLFEHYSITTSSTAKLSLVLLFR